MASDIRAINKYIFSSSDKLMFDTNVWFYIHGINAPYRKEVAIYSGVLSRVQRAKSRIYIDISIISEFINVYTNIARGLHNKDNPSVSFSKPKDFRNSSFFKPIARDISDRVRRILKICSFLESNLSIVHIQSIIDRYEKGDADFNDQVLVELCKQNNLQLITHDGDFKRAPITVITANRALLS